jgi:hypothetical protein
MHIMRTYKVNKIDHVVFDSKDEVPKDIHYLRDWREGHISDWVKADDGCIIQILRRGTMLKPKGRVRTNDYIGTCTGTFLVNKKIKMDTSRRMNIYSLGGALTPEEVIDSRKNLNSKEQLFVLYLAQDMPLQQAYLKAFPTNNPGYASIKAGHLFKTERVQTFMNEKLKPVLEELGIDNKAVLHGIKVIAQTAEKDDTKLKALFKLSDILDLEDKTRTSVQQISGAVFQGFSKEQLESVERKELTDGDN